MDKKTTLKVTEARPRDVGRGIARLDPKDIERIGASVGDVIELKGKKKTVAKVIPAYMEDRGKGIIQIDGINRENGQIGLDEKVEVQKIDAKSATRIILAPLTISSLRGESDTKYIGRLLDGLPLVTGNRVRANLFGTRSCDFKVLDAHPNGAVLIQPTTLIKIKTEEIAERRRGLKVSYEDIGGLGKQIQRVRELIELPLKYPQVFERLGIEAPKGIFLHGPPGCGKTLIARSVANETDAYFISISGPEIMGKYYGESEARLRSIFEDAQANAPAIIFLDEIESIAPKREEMGAEKQVERRVVAQLLALMDGLESRGNVIVIAATNLPNIVDPALRRPGRFDRELEIPIPDKNGRLEIIHIHTRGMPLAEDINLERLAEITHGFVGADLEALAREAAMAALRKILPKVDFELAHIPYETLLELQVTMDNFMEALKEIGPSAIREVFVEIPNVKWSDIGGLVDVKKHLIEAIEWPLEYPELFKYAKTNPPKGVLLHGKPGTGKTLIAKALANESGVNFISVKGPQLMSKFIGESERGVMEVFKKARQASPSILFFDELDAVVPIRAAGGDTTHVTERVISQFLTELDGIEELKGVVVLAATNRIDMIDTAVLRTGRFDLIFDLPVPDMGVREKIFEIHTRDKPLDRDVSLKGIAEKTEGFSGADIEAICRQASMLAIREFLDKFGKRAKERAKEFTIKKKYFQVALEAVRGRLKPEYP
ncbi:MAG: transitional endoplasmic reticulum ATPase [Candidatus Scalindua rubra]|uniref:Transitional endoplasmic reticulum ATPase n=1 Tax=Candidatus Scalindua rubra TaxID=1872076 RepID=A0A1E3XF66_9BACT|nr:MAG: transitional endoplasmic reticulum ATPase [Candidatus Scalindua rubra]